jgi:hypothetical protein
MTTRAATTRAGPLSKNSKRPVDCRLTVTSCERGVARLDSSGRVDKTPGATTIRHRVTLLPASRRGAWPFSLGRCGPNDSRANGGDTAARRDVPEPAWVWLTFRVPTARIPRTPAAAFKWTAIVPFLSGPAVPVATLRRHTKAGDAPARTTRGLCATAVVNVLQSRRAPISGDNAAPAATASR